EQLADAAGQLLDDAGLAGLHGRQVQLDAAGLDAVHGELFLRAVEQLGGLQQRLGGDAARVQARAAKGTAAVVVLPVVDARGLEAVLRRADGGRIAGRPAADDDHVEAVTHGLTWFVMRVKAGSAAGPDPR